MRIAMCMSGQLRTGVEAIPGVLRFVGELAPQVDWFIHTWDWSQQKRSLGCSCYPLRPTEPWMMQRMRDAYAPRDIRMDDHDATMAELNMPRNAGRGQWVSIHLCEQMRQRWCTANGVQHDVVMRIRPDMAYARRNTLASWVGLCSGAPPNILWSAIADQDRVDDVLWAASPWAMSRTATFHERLHGRAHDVIPGLELIQHMQEQGVEPREATMSPYDRVYAPIREESRHLDPCTQVGEIYAQDLMLYAQMQQDPQGNDVGTAQWLEDNSHWIRQL